MNFRSILMVVGTLVLLIDGAAADDVKITLSTGVDYTTGKYGGTEDIEDIYVPVTGNLTYGRLGIRLTVPYLSVRAPSGTVITDSSGNPLPGSGSRTTESGLGDIVGSLTLYDVIYSRDLGIAMDITGKVKLGTADETRGLGTGEHDYSAQVDLYKFFDQLTLLSSAGYKVRGDPTGLDLENVFLGSIGAIYKISPRNRFGLVYDYQESSFSGGKSIQELTGFVSQRLNDTWRVQFYALTGLSDSSPDWGIGVLLKVAI